MMDIKVVGEGCDKCDRLYENVMQAVDELGVDARIEKVEDLIEMVKLGVMSTPTLMIDGKTEILGQVASTSKIKEIIRQHV